MKRVGLIGGMSWHSTAMYYQYINEHINHRLGSHHSADIILKSLDFEAVLIPCFYFNHGIVVSQNSKHTSFSSASSMK